ncbi:hypothetical protein [Neobacillus sp. LXY-1]|uniref:hypothetical protein n=1 Tax=Neobacillus sp. LXY-1 TaxID=3379133 RepID=UPI003EE40A0C
MKKEKMMADQLQCMFLEGKLNGFKESYINVITRKLRTGKVSIIELMQEDPILKEKIQEALVLIESEILI